MDESSIILPKPSIGEKCNGCGLCCKVRVCMNGAFVLRLVSKLGDTIPGPCPVLISNKDGSYSCGIITSPGRYIKYSKYPHDVLSRNFAHLIGAGTGCDELLESDTESEIDKLMSIIEEAKSNSDWIKKTKIALKVIHGINI